jgi:hypothetical protein
MKAKALIISLMFLFGTLPVRAGGPIDPRFEGIWEGREAYKIENIGGGGTYPPDYANATIVIDPAGGQFGVLSGLGPGKYVISASQSKGNKIFFSAARSGTGRNQGTFILSADGNTITETGYGLWPCKPYACQCSITATFHRKGGAAKKK